VLASQNSMQNIGDLGVGRKRKIHFDFGMDVNQGTI
jgi:hypothetical protein